MAAADRAAPTVNDTLDRLRAAAEEWRRRARRRRLARGRRAAPAPATLWLVAGVVVLAAAVVWSFVYLRPAAPGSERRLDQLTALVAEGQVATATLLDQDARIVGTLSDGRPFWTAYPRNDATAWIVQDLTAAGAQVRVDPQTGKAVVRTVLTVLLPLMLLANLFALFFVAGRGGGSAMGEVVSFGRLGRRREPTGGAVTFADVAGADEAVVELAEVVDYLRDPRRYRELGANPPKGVLLFGPPGCGKTLLARAVAGEAGVPFFAAAGAEFVESLVGVGAARVRDLFARVRAVAPAIVFIDELDAAGRRRGGPAAGGGSDERDQTLNQLLVEMDGFDVSTGIVVIAATNRPDILDPALLRPGRLDRHITIDKPDVERRQAILALHAARKPVDRSVDFSLLARQTPGFSGADLANVVNEAALLTIRAGGSRLGPGAFAEAVQRVLVGPQRRGHLLSPDEQRRLAAHEGGHAIVAAATGQQDQIHRVSIVARGRGLGGTVLQRDDEPVLLTRSQLHARLLARLGGLAAEELLCGEPSTAAEDDLADASDLVRDLVGRYGMSTALGRRRLLEDDAAVHLGGEATLTPLSPETHARFDAECSAVLDAAAAEATELVRQHRAALEQLVDRLLIEETLEGAALTALLPAPEEGGERHGRSRRGQELASDGAGGKGSGRGAARRGGARRGSAGR
ncbi:MAG TPA: ATP-dependent zinc metalloprotease FtsH [Nitriliruptorales bacterium]|nr:ATP-dependent zinc metalloprotease FtsH [Nitriliruptorales bacterium]